MTSLRKHAARLSGLALVAAGLVLAQGFQNPASAVNIIDDPGFEETVAGDSPGWTEDDSLFDSPLCDVSCGDDFAHTGDWWAWFGGSSSAGHTGSLSQSLTIPVGADELTYWYLNPGGTAPLDATLTVKIDATTVKTHTEVASMSDYEQQTVDISAFDDGGTHTLSFSYLNPSAGLTAMMVDDVSIDDGVIQTATPTVTSATPPGPSNSTTPLVKGTAEAGSTVTLYSNGTCSSAALGTGPAADFNGAGITATVPANATTTIFAKATKAGQADSACSTTSVSYTNDSTAPETTITSSPAGGVAKSLTVPVSFTSSKPGSSFTCALDAGAFAPCTSPRSLTVTSGQHTFKVVAKDAANNTDATPASVTFTAYDCPTLTAAVAAAQAKADAADKKVKKANKALKKAKKSGDAKKIKKAKKAAKKAKKAAKAAKADLATAQSGAAPCGASGMARVALK